MTMLHVSRDLENFAEKIVAFVPYDARADDRETLAWRPGKEKVQFARCYASRGQDLVGVDFAEVINEELAWQVRGVGEAACRADIGGEPQIVAFVNQAERGAARAAEQVNGRGWAHDARLSWPG